MKKSTAIAIIALLIIGTLAISCAQEPMTTTVTQTTQGPTMTSTITTTQTTTVTVSQPPVTTTFPSPTTTARELAALGGGVYDLECYVDYCHDKWTAGGKEQFSGFNYAKYKTAQGFFTFIKYYMPNDFIGSVSDEELAQVSAYILTDLGKIPEDALFGLGNLDSFELN